MAKYAPFGSVQVYRSTDTGTTGLQGNTNGNLLGALYNCLVDNRSGSSYGGHGGISTGTGTITEVGTTYNVVSDNTSTLKLGDWIYWDSTGYNSTLPAGLKDTAFQITSYTDNKHWGFTGPGGLGVITTSTATHWFKCPLGYTVDYSTTNIYAFRSGDSSNNGRQHYFQVWDDSSAAGTPQDVKVTGFTSLVALGTLDPSIQVPKQMSWPVTGFASGVGGCGAGGNPNGVNWRKSGSNDATLRPWTIYADSKTVYLYLNFNITVPCLWGFGHFIPYRSTFLGNSFVAGQPTYGLTTGDGIGSSTLAGFPGGASNNFHMPYNDVNKPWGSKDYSAVVNAMFHVGGGAPTWNAGLVAKFPDPATGGTVLTVPQIMSLTGEEPSNGPCHDFVGRPAGLYAVSHPQASGPVAGDLLTNITGLSGRTLEVITPQSAGGTVITAAIDITGPWT